MTDHGSFDSAWRKWDWTARHAETFKAEINRFALDTDTQRSLRIRAEYQPHRHAFASVVDALSEFPPEWGLQLGDIAFNWRCSLDHLAWAIVSRGMTPPSTLPPRQQKLIYFPIQKTNRNFNGVRPRMLATTRSLPRCTRRTAPESLNWRQSVVGRL